MPSLLLWFANAVLQSCGEEHLHQVIWVLHLLLLLLMLLGGGRQLPDSSSRAVLLLLWLLRAVDALTGYSLICEGVSSCCRPCCIGLLLLHACNDPAC